MFRPSKEFHQGEQPTQEGSSVGQAPACLPNWRGWHISERASPVNPRFSRSVYELQPSEALKRFHSSTLFIETFHFFVSAANAAGASVDCFRESSADDRLSLGASLRDFVGPDPSPTPVIDRHG